MYIPCLCVCGLMSILHRLETEVKVLQDQLSSAPKQQQLNRSVYVHVHVHVNYTCTLAFYRSIGHLEALSKLDCVV